MSKSSRIKKNNKAIRDKKNLQAQYAKEIAKAREEAFNALTFEQKMEITLKRAGML